jgi:hypothetical protein
MDSTFRTGTRLGLINVLKTEYKFINIDNEKVEEEQ